MRILIRYTITLITFLLLFNLQQPIFADKLNKTEQLKKSYPLFIKHVTANSLVWFDGEKTQIRYSPQDSSSLYAQLHQPSYPTNNKIQCKNHIPKNDPGRIRNEYFFGKMYGHTENEVKNNLVKIYWMPHNFGEKYPLLVSKINHVDKKLKKISVQLEILVKNHPDFIKYLENPKGTFNWRNIENSNRKSLHSFGVAIDLNEKYTNYWIWDTGIQKNETNQVDNIPYQNRIPCEIVSIFENNGFIWGGKWLHYDTMHFEYRPELLTTNKALDRIRF